MPRIIHPTVTGSVTVELTIEDAHTLAEGLSSVLSYTVPETNQPMGRTPDGQTCMTFLNSLNNKIGYRST